MAVADQTRVSNFDGVSLTFFLGAATGTGAPQDVAHGLDFTPDVVLVVPQAGHDGMGGAGTQMPAIIAVSVDDTNVTFTCSEGAVVKVICF